jgi:gluconolactonase
MLRPTYCLLGFVVLRLAVDVAIADEPPSLPQFTNWVTAVAFSPLDGSLASVGGQTLLYRPGDVKLWDPADGKLKLSLDGHGTTVWAVAFSPDGRTMATAGYDGAIKLWDMPEGKPRLELKKHKHWVRALAFTPDGKSLVSGSEDTTVIIWDVSTGNDVKTIQAHAGPVNAVAISPDGKTLATAGGDKLAKLWDIETGTEKAKLEGHQDAVWTVAFRKDGTLLATAGADRDVRLWSTDGKPQGTLSGHKDWITTAAFSPTDNNLLATGSLDHTVKLWDVAQKKQFQATSTLKSSVWGIAFSADGKRLAIGSHGDSLKLWDLPEKLEHVESPILAAGAKLEKLAGGFEFTEGPSVDVQGNVYFTDQPNDRIMKWNIYGELSTFLKPAGRSNGLCFDAKNALWACADEKNELWRIDIATAQHEVMVKDYQGKLLNGPNDVWVRPDGGAYFTDPYYKRPYWKRGPKEQDQEATYYLAPDGKTLTRVIGDMTRPNGIIGTPDGKTLYVSDIDGGKTFAYDIQPDGSLQNKRLFCELGSDGMTLDDQGNVYLTGKGVTVFDKSGKQIEHIDVPEAWTGNVCFGGANMQTLFITASKGLYAFKMKVKGAARQ